MDIIKNALNWFEIPVADFERARHFYSDIFQFDMPVRPMGELMMGFLLHEPDRGIGGAIVYGEGYRPAVEGTLVYLNGGEDLNPVLERVNQAGGQVLVPKTRIAQDMGYYALFRDTEGNRLGLHSQG